MNIIDPNEFADANLVSSNVAEPAAGETLWVSGANYAVGVEATRISTHSIYERLIAGAGTTPPENDVVNWARVKPTLRHAMFDNVVGTSTTRASPLTVVLKPGFIGGLALIDVIAEQVQVSMKDATGGAVVFNRVSDMNAGPLEDIWSWFFGPIELNTALVFTDLPEQYSNPELTVTFTSGSTVSCGVLKAGRMFFVGVTTRDSDIGIDDYSVKTRDKFGNVFFAEGPDSADGNITVTIDSRRLNYVYQGFRKIKARPCVYICAPGPGFEPFVIYGAFETFKIRPTNPIQYTLTTRIKGLI